MTLNEIVNELVHSGIRIEMALNKDTGDVEYDLNVHFKSGIKLKENIDGEVVAVTRYYEQLVESTEEILHIYMKWFEDAQDRWGGAVMDSEWESIMIRYELIEVITETITSKSYKRT